MEQTNLIVTPDGKTWDEVTRDTSYIGNVSLRAGLDSGDIGTAAMIAHDCWRAGAKGVEWMNKDFAIAYDRVICLKDGNYRFHFVSRVTTGVNSPGTFGIVLNDADTANENVTGHIIKGYHNDHEQVLTLTGNYYLKRGDVISWQGPASDITQDTVQIERVK